MARSQREKVGANQEDNFFDIKRRGNGACRAKRMVGPSGDRTNKKQKNCKKQNKTKKNL